jgi:hypothetical protein
VSRPSRIPGIRRPQRHRVLLVLPTIPDDADTATKNALAARNACATEGRCPICGATAGTVTPDDALYNVFHLTFEHESGCPVPEVEAA